MPHTEDHGAAAVPSKKALMETIAADILEHAEDEHYVDTVTTVQLNLIRNAAKKVVCGKAKCVPKPKAEAPKGREMYNWFCAVAAEQEDDDHVAFCEAWVDLADEVIEAETRMKEEAVARGASGGDSDVMAHRGHVGDELASSMGEMSSMDSSPKRVKLFEVYERPKQPQVELEGTRGEEATPEMMLKNVWTWAHAPQRKFGSTDAHGRTYVYQCPETEKVEPPAPTEPKKKKCVRINRTPNKNTVIPDEQLPLLEARLKVIRGLAQELIQLKLTADEALGRRFLMNREIASVQKKFSIEITMWVEEVSADVNCDDEADKREGLNPSVPESPKRGGDGTKPRPPPRGGERVLPPGPVPEGILIDLGDLPGTANFNTHVLPIDFTKSESDVCRQFVNQLTVLGDRVTALTKSMTTRTEALRKKSRSSISSADVALIGEDVKAAHRTLKLAGKSGADFTTRFGAEKAAELESAYPEIGTAYEGFRRDWVEIEKALEFMLTLQAEDGSKVPENSLPPKEDTKALRGMLGQPLM